MTFHAEAVHQSVCDVLDGAQGPYASQLAKLFAPGTFEGQTDRAAQAKTIAAEHTYDVILGTLRDHEGSPVGAIGSFRLAVLEITVRVLTRLAPQNDHAARLQVARQTARRLDLVSQSLGTPHALDATASGETTGIISGLLRGPAGDGFPEVSPGVYEWEKRQATHEIRARAIVRIDRP